MLVTEEEALTKWCPHVEEGTWCGEWAQYQQQSDEPEATP